MNDIYGVYLCTAIMVGGSIMLAALTMYLETREDRKQDRNRFKALKFV